MTGTDGQAATPEVPPWEPQSRARSIAAQLILWLGRIAAIAAGLASVTAGVLAVRLAQGPMEITRLVRHFTHRPIQGARLALGLATLEWDIRAPQSPLTLTLRDLILTRTDGTTAARMHLASIGVMPAKLLLGQVRAVLLSAGQGSVALARAANGAITLDSGAPIAASKPPGIDLRRLRQVTLHAVTATVTDRAANVTWQVQAAAIALAGLDHTPRGTADLAITLAGQTSRLTATLASNLLTGAWTAIDPARLGPLANAAASADLPVAGRFRLTLAPSRQPRTLAADLTLGAGRLHVADGLLPVASGQAHIDADLTAHRANLTAARLQLDDHPSAGPLLTAAATLQWAPQTARAAVTIDVDHLDIAALARFWPTGAARGARAWMTANATAGQARAIHLEAALSLAPGAIQLTAATGRLQAQDLTLHWLRPVPPLIHAEATLALQSADALLVTVTSATQTPSDPAAPPLTLHNATMRITGLSAPDQTATIEADLSGPVAQHVALLREPRLRLLSAHPVDLGTPSGDFTTRLQVRLPLASAVTIDQVAIRATGQLTALHLGGIIGGKNLDAGNLALTATNDGLKLDGSAQLAGVPSTLQVGMDFRAGPPDQVVTTYHAAGSAPMAALQAAGLPTGGLAEGTVGYDATLSERRDGTGRGRVHIDLRGAGLALPALGWRKPPDTDSTVDATIALDHERLVAVDNLSVTGPDVALQGHASYAPGKPVTLELDQIELGRTRAAGRLTFPTAADPTLHADLHGPLIDLGSRVKPGAPPPTPTRAQAQAATRQRQTAAAARQRGQPWTARLRFDQVLLGPSHALTNVAADAQDDGLLIQHARITGTAGSGTFALTLAANGRARSVQAQATDAGGLMRALDLTTSVQGGTLDLQAAYDDTQPDHPLAGTAKIDRFQVNGAPAVARLLQAMTLYGVVDVLRGPGLGFSHLVAPFRFADDVLALNNARAFSSSLGFTAKGDIDLAAQRADLTGTIIPGYFFNTLLGKLPLLGKIFSPEQGGGVLSATYGLSGALASPKVKINPLAALTPGILRNLFGITGTAPPEPAPPTPPPAPTSPPSS